MLLDGWVVLRVLPQYLVRADVNVRNQGAEFYAPRAMVRSEKTRALVRRPLFPGYAFARHPERRWSFLWSTFGVQGVLMGTGDHPALLPHAEIVKLRVREGEDGLVRLESSEFTVGEKVRVDKGVVSLDAIIDGMASQDRVFVLMRVLGTWTRTNVDVASISHE